MRYSLLIILLFFNSKILLAACPSGDDGQTVNILSGDSCTTRISNPQSTINVAGSLTVNSGDGAIYFNTGSHNLTITGTVKNTNTGTSHGIRDVATNVTSVTISGNGSVTGNVAGYYNEGSNVTLTTNQSNLVFKGKVPNTYEILIESSSDFGKTFFTPADISGTLGFSIGSDSSISTAGTYSSVLNNITSDNISSTRSGTFSTYNWVLEQSSPGSSTWDLVFTDSRTAYTTRISNVKLSEIATVLETINTNGSNATLTSNLDGLSEGELLKALRQIKGTTIQKSIGQSLRSNNKFNQAMISATSGPNFSQLVKNNFANLSFDDVQNFYNPEIEKVNLTNDFTFSDIANIYSKRNLLKIGSSENSIYLRTFGGITDQEKVGDDVGYESTTAGFVFGNQSIIDNLQAGWGLGFSTTGLDYDDGFGLNNTNTLHASLFAVKEYKKFDTSLNLGSFISKINSTRNITEGSTQTLKSDRYELGLDLTGGISKKIILGGWVFNPSATINAAYVLQDNIDESGGDLALKIKTDNLLQIKPELGFNLEREFSNNSFVLKGFNLSLFGSEENKLDGADAVATIKDTGDGYALSDSKKKDQFITAGLGYSSANKRNESQFLINAFSTQNKNNDMNSSLVSFTYKKKF